MTDCDEGTLVWVKDEAVKEKKMWEGDRLFLQEMEQSDRIFCFELHYDEMTTVQLYFDPMIYTKNLGYPKYLNSNSQTGG